jgi:hypothetical protein
MNTRTQLLPLLVLTSWPSATAPAWLVPGSLADSMPEIGAEVSRASIRWIRGSLTDGGSGRPQSGRIRP